MLLQRALWAWWACAIAQMCGRPWRPGLGMLSCSARGLTVLLQGERGGAVEATRECEVLLADLVGDRYLHTRHTA